MAKKHVEWARTQGPAVRALQVERDRLLKQIDKLRSGGQIIVDAVAQSIGENPPVIDYPKAPRKFGSKSAEEIACVHVTDVQYGKRTATYNGTVADERIALIGRKVEEVTMLRRHYATIRDCRIYLGGDMVEGENIFPGQAHEIDQSLFQQALRGLPTALSKLVLHMLRVFEKVTVVGVRGNHGRPGRFGNGDNRQTNWDTVSFRALELMILGPHCPESVRKRVRFAFSEETFFQIDRVFDWGNLLVHGDQISGGFAGFPWYGAAKKAWGWVDTLPAQWDYIWTGHFHTPASMVLNKRELLAGGTTESDNEYAQEQLAAGGYPRQRLAYFNAKYGLISDVPLYLDDTRVPNKVRGRRQGR